LVAPERLDGLDAPRTVRAGKLIQQLWLDVASRSRGDFRHLHRLKSKQLARVFVAHETHNTVAAFTDDAYALILRQAPLPVALLAKDNLVPVVHLKFTIEVDSASDATLFCYQIHLAMWGLTTIIAPRRTLCFFRHAL